MKIKSDESLFYKIESYELAIPPTDRLPKDDLRPVLMGLFGEVGSIMAPVKKLHREKEAYTGYISEAEEEFGDALWYLATLANRLELKLADIIADTIHGKHGNKAIAATDIPSEPIAEVSSIPTTGELDDVLLKLGETAGNLLTIKDKNTDVTNLLSTFVRTYLAALQLSGLSFTRIIMRNLEKVQGRFLSPDITKLRTFDQDFDADEQLPDHFEILFKEKHNGRTYMQWNGVFIGEPLTDNIADSDDYRYHDIFQLHNL